MTIQPYLFFQGRTEEALDFYTRALGAKVGMKMRFKESPERLEATDDYGMVASVSLPIAAFSAVIAAPPRRLPRP